MATMTLRGLPGTSGDVEAALVTSVRGAVKKLRQGDAVTAAQTNGAINVWIDSKGIYQGELCRNLRTVSVFSCSNLKCVREHLKEWFEEIQ